jgi:hypothetical protein
VSTVPGEPVPPLFQGLFDDAALFPPASTPLQRAVRLHEQYLRSRHAGLVGAFVCASTRLAELSDAVADGDSGEIAVSLTVPGGRPQLAGALRSIGEHSLLRLAAIELPVPALELSQALEDLSTVAGTRGCVVFVEVPAADLTAAITDQLADAGLGLKLRTGGTSAEAFPTGAVLAAAIGTAVRSGVEFKCTAGLHNAIAHLDPATGFAHHGFLNVLLAVHAAQTGSAAVADQLAAHDPDELAGQLRALSPEAVGTIRAQFRSIGSCSIEEPLADLQTLGLVNAA